MPGKVLGQRGGFELSDLDLQPERLVPAAFGLAAEGDDPLAEILALRDGRSFKLSTRKDHN